MTTRALTKEDLEQMCNENNETCKNNNRNNYTLNKGNGAKVPKFRKQVEYGEKKRIKP